jgi:hypothetical protein
VSKASGDTAPDDRKGRLRAMLEAAGFIFNKTAECWVHKKQGRVISEDTVFAHDEPWLKAWIGGK